MGRRWRWLGGCLALVAAAAGTMLVAAPTAAIGPFENAPDPGGKERAIVRVPPPGERVFGIHEPTILGPSFHGWSPRDIAKIADDAGTEVFRFTIDWFYVEPQQDVWDEDQWARYQAAYDALVARGIKPFITVAVAPPWARDPGLPMLCNSVRLCEFPPRPSMFGEWAEFVAAVGRRFPKTAAIEIWNEPNMSGFWKPEADPERYAGMVAAAYDALKVHSPQIDLVAGGLAGAAASTRDPSTNQYVMSMREFLTRAYQARPSIAGHMDGLSFHQAEQATRFGEGSRLAQSFHTVREIRNKYDPNRTPLWVSEFGLSTSDGPRVTPEVQAHGHLRAYRRVLTMPDVKGFIIHSLGGQPEHPDSERARGDGIIETFNPFVPKPAYCAFAGRLRNPVPGIGCKPIRESHVSKCSRSLVSLTKQIAKRPGSARSQQLRRRHDELLNDCVPGNRKGAVRCYRELGRLERKFVNAIPTLRLDLLNRHSTTLRGCR